MWQRLCIIVFACSEMKREKEKEVNTMYGGEVIYKYQNIWLKFYQDNAALLYSRWSHLIVYRSYGQRNSGWPSQLYRHWLNCEDEKNIAPKIIMWRETKRFNGGKFMIMLLIVKRCRSVEREIFNIGQSVDRFCLKGNDILEKLFPLVCHTE